jgi:hypothetical protein
MMASIVAGPPALPCPPRELAMAATIPPIAR